MAMKDKKHDEKRYRAVVRVMKGEKKRREEERKKRERAEATLSALAGKNWNSLKGQERDTLLKVALMRLGLLNANGDVVTE